MSDGTDRGAARPIRDDELDDIRRYAAWEKDAEPHVLRAIIRQCVREIDRLRALSTGEPSPDSAALRAEARTVADEVECNSAPIYQRAARAIRALDRALVSLLARLTAAERDAALGAALRSALATVPEGHELSIPANGSEGWIGPVCSEWKRHSRNDATLALRAALPPSGDTRGEQP